MFSGGVSFTEVRWLPPDPNDHSKLIEPESGVALSIEECSELARDQNLDQWELASRFAQRMVRFRDPFDRRKGAASKCRLAVRPRRRSNRSNRMNSQAPHRPAVTLQHACHGVGDEVIE